MRERETDRKTKTGIKADRERETERGKQSDQYERKRVCVLMQTDFLSCAIFSLSEMSTVLTTASAFFLACSIFFSVYNITHKQSCSSPSRTSSNYPPSFSFPPCIFLSLSLTLLFLRALASASLLIGRALISFHFCLYSSTISRVTGMGFFLCFFSSDKNHTGISPDSCELENLRQEPNTRPSYPVHQNASLHYRTRLVWYDCRTADLWKDSSIRSRRLFLDVAI